MWIYTILSSFVFFYFFSKKNKQTINKNNFNYVLYKKNSIKSFICYWITYVTSINQLYNCKAVNNNLNEFIIPKNMKGNIISFNLNFDEPTIINILNKCNKFVMWYDKNINNNEYNNMINNLLIQYTNFSVCDFSDTNKSVYKKLLTYYNYKLKLPLIEIIDNNKLSENLTNYLFPKNYRLSHLTKFNNSKNYIQKLYLMTAKSLYTNKYAKIKHLSNKLYIKTINKNYLYKNSEAVKDSTSLYKNGDNTEIKIGFINNGFYKSEIANYILENNKELDVVIVWSFIILNNIPTYCSTIRTSKNVNINDIINSNLFIEGSGYNGIGGAISSVNKWNEFNNFAK